MSREFDGLTMGLWGMVWGKNGISICIGMILV